MIQPINIPWNEFPKSEAVSEGMIPLSPKCDKVTCEYLPDVVYQTRGETELHLQLLIPVSYTHLDVYKRQEQLCSASLPGLSYELASLLLGNRSDAWPGYHVRISPQRELARRLSHNRRTAVPSCVDSVGRSAGLEEARAI